MNSDLFDANGALFSDCRKYRYALWRIWDKQKPLVMFIGLNPSKADEINQDPTITRVRAIAESLGYGGFYMMNCFAFVTPYPFELKIEKKDPLNDFWLNEISKKCADIIFAWGKFKAVKERAVEVAAMFPSAKALIINLDGSPRHPLYVKTNVSPVEFKIKTNASILI